jgi:hypothetical protein
MWCSSFASWMTLSLRDTPMSRQKLLMPSAEKPRRLKPLMVGMRGSSQPLTTLSRTSASSLRFDSGLHSMLRRENSQTRGRHMSSASSSQ